MKNMEKKQSKHTLGNTLLFILLGGVQMEIAWNSMLGI